MAESTPSHSELTDNPTEPSHNGVYKSLHTKTLNELGSQAAESFPTYTRSDLPDAEKRGAAKEVMRDNLKEFMTTQPSDSDITSKLKEITEFSDHHFIERPQDNPTDVATLADVYSKMYSDMSDVTKEETDVMAVQALASSSYLAELRRNRKQWEFKFAGPIRDFVGEEPLGQEDARQLEVLKTITIDLSRLSPEQKEHLEMEFPGGNFIFHGTKTEQAIAIISRGELVNAHILFREHKADQDVSLPVHHSGYEGISWSMNAIDALPGDRFHLAGFLASPETVLDKGEQLAIPSRPSPYEAIQITGNIDPRLYYTLKVQDELITSIGMGEHNSVFSSLFALKSALEEFHKEGTYPEDRTYAGTPRILEYVTSHTDSELTDVLGRLYSIREDGTVDFSPNLSQQRQDQEQIPVGAVYLQALLQSGRITDLPGFSETPKTLRELVMGLTELTIPKLIEQAKLDRDFIQNKIAIEEDKIRDIKVPIDKMFFVCPAKDVYLWQLVFAKAGCSPRGILTYPGGEVRMENFASDHTGDHAKLTKILQTSLPPSDGYIDYEYDLLGIDITPNIRAGHRHHVIGEEFLINRKVLRKNDAGKLVIDSA